MHERVDSNDNKLIAPLRPQDLASPDVEHLSYAGAHTYLQTKVDYLGLPPIFYRQFSDWSPTGPLFDPLLKIVVPDNNGQPLPTEVTHYEWRPDRVTLACKYGDVLEGRQVIGYLSEGNIIAIIELHAISDDPVTLQLLGKLTNNVPFATVEPWLEMQGFRFVVETKMHNPWGYPESKFKIESFIASNISGFRYNQRGHDYEGNYRIAGGDSVTLKFLYSHVGMDMNAKNSLLRNAEKRLDETTEQVQEWLNEVKIPPVTDDHQLKMYYNAWYQFWYNIEHAEGFWSRPIITPSKSAYARGVWLWDTGFHIFGLLQGGEKALQLAKDQVIVLADGGKRVGHLPREVWVDATATDLQAPGILTWAAMEIYKRDGDKAFLEAIYDSFAANNEWYYANKDSNGNGLCEWQGGDSGWDTNPRWDKGEPDAVDLNCWLYLDQVLLAEMARILGKDEDAEKWVACSEKTKSLTQEILWDEEDGCYYDRLVSGELVKVKTPATFWTMFTGVATPEQAERMVKVLQDPDSLWTAYPMPSTGVNEPTFEPENYWRGPVWINLNWITILGLEKYGYEELARELRNKSLEVIAMNPVPYEYYNPLNGKGIGASNFMWTGAIYIAMLADWC